MFQSRYLINVSLVISHKRFNKAYAMLTVNPLINKLMNFM